MCVTTLHTCLPEVKRLDSFGCMVLMGGKKGIQAGEHNAKHSAHGADRMRRDSFAMPIGPSITAGSTGKLTIPSSWHFPPCRAVPLSQ